jgi:hypothetical protein
MKYHGSYPPFAFNIPYLMFSAHGALLKLTTLSKRLRILCFTNFFVNIFFLILNGSSFI